MAAKYELDKLLAEAREDDKRDQSSRRILGQQEIEEMIVEQRKGKNDRDKTGQG